MNTKRVFSRIIAIFLTLVLTLAIFLPAQVARADSITVTTTSDGTGGPYCTLRDAIKAADTDSAIGSCPAGSGADTIVLASNATYILTVSGLSAIHSQITIEGNGSTIERSSADGTPEFRIFYVAEAGDLTLKELTVKNGRYPNDADSGGGVKNWGSLKIDNSTFSSNFVGAILTLQGSSLNISNSTISDNSGGGILINRATVVLENSTISSNDGNSYGGGINNYFGEVYVYNSTISGNSVSIEGGGIRNRGGVLTLTNSTVSDNIEDGDGKGGGGILVDDYGMLTMTNSTVNGNSAIQGGGISVYGHSKATVINSTISENKIDPDHNGGGIRVGAYGELALINSTVSNNYNGFGTGIAISVSSKAKVINSTISHNQRFEALKVNITNRGELSMTNTIIGDQLSGVDCQLGEFAITTSLGYNLDSDGSCNLDGIGDISNADPNIGPLQDNGGPTWTHALLRNSPAIDAVPTGECPLTTDQRGILRPQILACDIGAYELRQMEVDIDIKPGSDPSCFNNDGHGVIPVAILGNSNFDVYTIDPGSVSLEGLAIAANGKSNKLLAAYEDVNGDGYTDLVIKIEDRDGVFSQGSGTAVLKGTLYDGTLIFGVGDICITQ